MTTHFRYFAKWSIDGTLKTSHETALAFGFARAFRDINFADNFEERIPIFFRHLEQSLKH